MMTLLIALVVMIAVEGFLTFLTTEYRMVTRTYSYGSAVYLAEAGVEEGFAMLNYGSGAWAANGWSSLNTTNYTKTASSFTSNDGSVVGKYVINVFGATGNNPVLVCTGIVDVSHASIDSRTTNITRAVKAILGNRATFRWGLLARSTIDLNGNNADLDSFDSSDSSHSNWQGSYGIYDSSKRNDNGDAATNAGITNSIAAGNANIYGHVATGSGGTVSVGSNGFVGSLTDHPNGVIQSDRVSHSISVDLSLPTVPFTSGSTISGNISSDYSIVGSGSSLPSDKIITGSISLSGNEILSCSGYSRIYVQGSVNTEGNAKIYLYPGAKVELYVAGSISLAGNGVQNDAGTADKFQVYNLGGYSTAISGNGAFTGVVYAPGSAVSIGGNGTVNGAVVGNTITLDGNAAFHYDEALKKTGPTRGYSILTWQEL
jgi:hypothetical protein